jgi:diguanylate cyclase (GGDEF)-like protein
MRLYLGLPPSVGQDRTLPEILGADRYGKFEGRIKACLNGAAQDFHEGGEGPGKGIHARFVPAKNAEGEIVGFVAMMGEARDSDDLEKTLAVREEALLAREIEFRRQSTTDSLSGTLTRSAILQLLEEEIRRASRYGRPFALVLFDLDHFKLVNDIHGRAAGDEAIRRFASICRTCFRTTDYLGRYGGEEFLGILPEVDGEGGLLAADRVRSALQAERFRLPRPLGAKSIEDEFTVTVSAGIAGFEKGYDSDTMLAAADKALYKAKDQGRNRVVLHGRH